MKHSMSLGLIAAYFGGKILSDAVSGTPSPAATKISDLFGGKKREAILLSFALGVVGLWIGLRSLNSNSNSLGNDCGCGHNCGCRGLGLF